MGEIILHAGPGKTGSSSIQAWMAEELRTLTDAGVWPLRVKREKAGDVKALRAAPRPRPRWADRPGGMRVVRARRTSMNSNAYQLLIGRLGRRDDGGERAERFNDGFVNDCETLASALGTVLLSSEGFGTLLAQRDRWFLHAVRRLSKYHQVRVILYLRPQHDWLEAVWRQVGWRRRRGPRDFVDRLVDQLDYESLLADAREAAPGAEFVARPYRRDLLAGGDVVVDFARLLGFEAKPGRLERNPSVPLEVANLLSVAPEGRLSLGSRDGQRARLMALKEAASELDVIRSPAVDEGRELLRAWCHHSYEASNRRLLDDHGWTDGPFVPGPSVPTLPDLAALDELWAPVETTEQRERLYTALADGLAARAD